MSAPPGLDARAVAALYDLAPMPLEGGLFRRLWAGEPDATNRPAGSSIIVLLDGERGELSAMHRLPVDEVWHFYLGDPLDLLLLFPDGSWQLVRMGHQLDVGEQVQVTVPADVWMGARVGEGGRWALFGCTMAPGFMPEDYQGGGLELCDRYPDAADHIRARHRPGVALRHPTPQSN